MSDIIENNSAMAVDSETWVCPSCGKPDNNGAFCESCGCKRIVVQSFGTKSTVKKPFKNIMPVAASVITGAAAVALAVVFVVNAVPKFGVLSAYNAEKQKHDTAVAEAEAKITEYKAQADELNEQTKQLEESVVAKTKENSGLDVELSELSDKRSALSVQKNVLADNIISPDYKTSEYAEEQLAEIIIAQQNSIYELKKKLSEHIKLMYDEFKMFVSSDVNFDYLYEVEPPMDLSKELAKEIIGKVAGEFDSKIADFAAGVVSGMIDGSDLASAIGSQLQDSVQSKISSAKDNALDAVTGGLYGKFTEAVDVVGHFKSLYDKISNDTPVYCVRYLYQEMQKCVTEIGAFLDNNSVTAEDIAALIDTANRLSILEKSFQDVSGIGLFVPYLPSLNLCNTVRNAYNQIIVDNERMAYYFALMEE